MVAANGAPGLHPVTALETWPQSWVPKLLLLLAAVVVAGIASGILRQFLRRRRTPAPVRALPAHEKAFSALQALLARGWIESGEAEPFYVQLSGIVRRYLEERFQIRAPELTTDEFLRATAASALLKPAQRQRTAAFLAQSDLVKFARHSPDSATMRAAYEAAWRLIEETRAAKAPGAGGPAS